MEEAFPSVSVIPPIASTLIAPPAVDIPNPGSVIIVTGVADEIYTDGSLPVLEAALEQLQVSAPDGAQSPANDGEDQTNSDVNAAAETTETPASDRINSASQGAIPPATPLYLPMRPPRKQVSSL